MDAFFFKKMTTDRYNQRGVSADKEDVHNVIKNVDKVKAEITNSTVSGNSIAVQLRDLNEMYKSGVLTKEEFEMAKKKTLSQ